MDGDRIGDASNGLRIAIAAAVAAATGDEHPDDVGIVTGGALDVGEFPTSDNSNSNFGFVAIRLAPETRPDLPRFSIGFGIGYAKKY